MLSAGKDLMGFSGSGLYDDDVAEDVRSRYRELISDGVAGEAATDALIDEWAEVLDDPDQSQPFWLALADTQWRVGRLEDRVKEAAARIISAGSDLDRFAHDRKLLGQRRKILADLARRLAAPQRRPARVKPVFRSESPVAIGDVFSFDLGDGDLVFLRTVRVEGSDVDSQPIVEVLDWQGSGEPHDPATLPTRRSLRGGTPQFWLIHRKQDPDPMDRIVIRARGAPAPRPIHMQSELVAWPDLREALERTFGSIAGAPKSE